MALSTHSHYAAVGLLALAALASCKKTDKETVAPTAPVVAPPAETPTFFPGIAVTNSSTVLPVSGTLVSLRTDVNYLQPNSSYLQSVRTETVRANFYPSRTPGTPVSYEEAGEVKVNGISLEKSAENTYSKTFGYGLTGSPLLTTTKTEWEVAGAGNVPAIPLYNNTLAFSSYNGTPFQRRINSAVTTRQVVLTSRPTAIAINLIDRNDDLVLPLGSSISAADSLYVIITDGAAGRVLVRTTTQPVAATLPPMARPAVPAPSEVTVPAARLATLAPNSNGTAFLQTVAFRTVTIQRGGKNFTFVKAGARFTPISIQ